LKIHFFKNKIKLHGAASALSPRRRRVLTGGRKLPPVVPPEHFDIGNYSIVLLLFNMFNRVECQLYTWV